MCTVIFHTTASLPLLVFDCVQRHPYIHTFIILVLMQESVQSIHPKMHQIVEKNPENYLEFDPLVREYLITLRKNGKNVFLITNSPFNFV